MLTRRDFLCAAGGSICVSVTRPARAAIPQTGLIGHWKMQNDCRDSSGHGHHGENRGVVFPASEFDGKGSHVFIPDAPSLRLGANDFSLSAWVHTEKDLTDVLGDVISKFDPIRRKGFTLGLGASNAGYNSTSNARHVHFGIDADTAGHWTDCGRPGGKSHNSDALTVFEGNLYAGTCDAAEVNDWAHVYRYLGEQNWEDCGRIGTGRTRGVYALIVHDGALYAATSASHGRQPKTMDFGRVYRYRGDKQWEGIGQPGENYRLNSLASFQGKLYACAFNIGSPTGYCYVYEGGTKWRVSGEFPGAPHTLTVHNGKLYTGYPKGEVFAFDGEEWKPLGNPFGTTVECNQIHSLGVYRGELHAGTWPKGKVAVLRDGRWVDRGRLGDATEVIALTVYNGCLYAGTIPRAEVFRHQADDRWVSIRRLFGPPGFEPVPVGSGDAQGIIDWSRATSLAVFRGKLFVSTGTCYRTMIDPPRPEEIRGRVYAFSTGVNVTHDSDIGPGWKHIVATRDGNRLKLYVDGRQTDSAVIADQSLDLSNDVPLLIGSGPQDFFRGRIRDVRLYNRALAAAEVETLFRETR